MRLATLTVDGATCAAVLVDHGWRLLDEPDVGSLLQRDDWRQHASASDGTTVTVNSAQHAALVPAPSKVLCVGLNYRNHITEMGRDLPAYPTLFAKFADTLAGPSDDIAAVPEDPALDWEGELAIVIGKGGRRIAEAHARDHIAGYTIANDISMRGWQFRTKEWLQGKAWDSSTPVGPMLVTQDEVDLDTAVLTTSVNGETMQHHALRDLLFTPEHLVAYASTIVRLRAGDLILTGTPGGVGRARHPQVYLQVGDEVSVSIDGLGTLRSRIVEER